MSKLRPLGPTLTIDLPVLLACMSIALALSWIGYQGWSWDDAHYLTAAERWSQDGFHLGRTHWELRHGYVLPLALSLHLFGSNESALILVSVLFYAGLVGLTYWFCRNAFGRETALLSAILVATLPVVAAWATTPRPAIAEAFYLMGSLLCFASAMTFRRNVGVFLFVAGLLLGLGWLTRESALGLGAAYAALFLIGRPVARPAYTAMAAGFAIVIGLEFAFFQSVTGNPFYRLAIDLNHGTITSAGGSGEAAVAIVQAADGAGTGGGAAQVIDRLSGYFDASKIADQGPATLIHVNPFLDPYLAFFSDPYYGVIFLLAIPAALYLWFYKKIPERSSRFLKLVLVVGVVFVLFMLYGLFLRPLPRYFLFVACLAALIVGLALAEIWRRRARTLVLVVLASVLLVNVVFMESRRGLGLYNERRLVEVADRLTEPVFTDPATLRMAKTLLRWRGLQEAVVAGKPPPGGLYFLNAERAFGSAHREWLMADGVRGWDVEFSHTASKRWLAVVLDAAGISAMIPASVYGRLASPYGTVLLVRAPAAGDSGRSPGLDSTR